MTNWTWPCAISMPQTHYIKTQQTHLRHQIQVMHGCSTQHLEATHFSSHHGFHSNWKGSLFPNQWFLYLMVTSPPSLGHHNIQCTPSIHHNLNPCSTPSAIVMPPAVLSLILSTPPVSCTPLFKMLFKSSPLRTPACLPQHRILCTVKVSMAGPSVRGQIILVGPVTHTLHLHSASVAVLTKHSISQFTMNNTPSNFNPLNIGVTGRSE